MKKLLFLLLLLLIATPCFAQWQEARMLQGVVGGGVPAGTPPACPSGTYYFAWNGDYTADTDKGCFGSTPADGTATGTIEITSAYGRTGNGLRVNAEGEGLAWTAFNLDNDAFTVWVDLYLVTYSNITVIWEFYYDASDYMYARLQVGSLPRVYLVRGGTEVLITSVNALADSTWTTLGISFRDSTNELAIKVGANAWESDEFTFGAWTNEPTVFRLGNVSVPGFNSTAIYYDNLYISNGFETAHP